MTACTNEDDFAPIANNEIRVDATIGQMTRVANNGNSSAFESGDQISVFAWTGVADEVPATRVVDGAVNTFDGTNWTAAPQMLWKDMTSEHYFLAVYPSHPITDFTADTYTLNTADQEKSDLLVAINNTGLKAQNNPVPLTFDHLMAKLVVNLNFRTQWSSTPTVESVKLDGYTDATVNYMAKSVAGTTKGDVALNAATTAPAGYEMSYSSIVIPSTDSKTITIRVEGKDYVYNHSSYIPLESGQYTTINLNVGRDAISLAGVTIADWTEGAKIEGGEAEEVVVPAYTTSEADGVTTYTVYTAEGLQAVNEILVAQTGAVYDNITLAKDIDLTTATTNESGSNWTPIDIYSGTFDGNGKTIAGLTIKSSLDYQGLIGSLEGGTIKNLTLTNCTVSGGSIVGAFAAYNTEGVNKKGDRLGGTISGCTLNGTSSISGAGNHVGGIAAYCMGDGLYSTIIGCTVSGNVTISGSKFIGGIASDNGAGYVTACLVQGANIQGTSYLGGVVGYITHFPITGCYAYGCTTGENKDAFSGDANIFGNNEYGTISHCYYTTAGDSSTFGTVGGSASDWSSAMSAMNGAISGWQWSGTQDNPTLTKN